jgi:hypothetical protein
MVVTKDAAWIKPRDQTSQKTDLATLLFRLAGAANLLGIDR